MWAAVWPRAPLDRSILLLATYMFYDHVGHAIDMLQGQTGTGQRWGHLGQSHVYHMYCDSHLCNLEEALYFQCKHTSTKDQNIGNLKRKG